MELHKKCSGLASPFDPIKLTQAASVPYLSCIISPFVYLEGLIAWLRVVTVHGPVLLDLESNYHPMSRGLDQLAAWGRVVATNKQMGVLGQSVNVGHPSLVVVVVVVAI